jgi:serine/threonine protein kinase
VPAPSVQNPSVPPALDAIILRALQRNPADRWQSAAEMADALDDVVHEARFQPTHLAHLLYQLFPVEGGVPRSPTMSSGVSQISTSTGASSVRSRTVPPTTVPRTASGAGTGAIRYGNVPPPQASLAPKSKVPAVLMTLVVLGGGGAAAWKFLGHQKQDFRMTSVGDPNRRFYIHVKSTPEGANIYLDDGKKERLMGSTPVTLPIDLTGLASVKLHLKKEGFETYEQIVANDDPLTISLTPVGGAPAATSPAAADAGVAAPEAPAPTTSKPSRPKKKAAPKPEAGKSDEPAGEITD